MHPIRAGHFGYYNIAHRVASSFYWLEWRKDIKRWVRECDISGRAKIANVPIPGLLQPLSIPDDQVWCHVSIDFVDGLPVHLQNLGACCDGLLE